MNESDSEIVRSILLKAGHVMHSDVNTADIVLTNTCAIRENAEMKVHGRLAEYGAIRRKRRQKNQPRDYPIIGVLGCMAERLKEKLLETKSVDFVCGPDAYRDIPRLLNTVLSSDMKEANTLLSIDETYADVTPVREANSGKNAFVSIMRGCNNMCSFCIVPFTRGRERSRELNSIMKEVENLSSQGVKEVVLLGQNVNGYHDISSYSAELYPTNTEYKASSSGFSNMFNGKIRNKPGARFADLLKLVAAVNPDMRVRFTSPHPKDFPEEVLEAVATVPNICKSLHMPLQSGSTSTLQRMRRGYSREAFLDLIQRTRETIPGVGLSTDMIVGFCGETEEEHLDTLSAMREVSFDQAFMFAYSLREKTHADRVMVSGL
jgi:MiaB/RimO family radical SAM methylthiotransferase